MSKKVLKMEQKMIQKMIQREQSVALVQHYGIKLPCVAFCGPVRSYVCSLIPMILCDLVWHFVLLPA